MVDTLDTPEKFSQIVNLAFPVITFPIMLQYKKHIIKAEDPNTFKYLNYYLINMKLFFKLLWSYVFEAKKEDSEFRFLFTVGNLECIAYRQTCVFTNRLEKEYRINDSIVPYDDFWEVVIKIAEPLEIFWLYCNKIKNNQIKIQCLLNYRRKSQRLYNQACKKFIANHKKPRRLVWDMLAIKPDISYVDMHRIRSYKGKVNLLAKEPSSLHADAFRFRTYKGRVDLANELIKVYMLEKKRLVSEKRIPIIKLIYSFFLSKLRSLLK